MHVEAQPRRVARRLRQEGQRARRDGLDGTFPSSAKALWTSSLPKRTRRSAQTTNARPPGVSAVLTVATSALAVSGE